MEFAELAAREIIIRAENGLALTAMSLSTFVTEEWLQLPHGSVSKDMYAA